MQSASILLIDDDRRLAEMVGRYLGQAGFSVQVQGTARAGLEALVERTPDTGWMSAARSASAVGWRHGCRF